MKIIWKNAGADPEVKDIPNTLDALQHAVGGYIEVVNSGYKNVVMIVNEEGKLRGMPPNMVMNGIAIVGPIVFAGTKNDDFIDLKDFQVEIIMEDIKEAAL